MGTPAGGEPHRHAGGMSVGGPESVTPAPSAGSAWTFERATREWRMSPTIAIRLLASDPRRARSVYTSRSACVGCACQPSPAFTTDALTRSATKYGAPDEP